MANYAGGSVSELSGAQSNSPGSARSPAGGFVAKGLVQPFAVAIDPSGNLWVSNFGNDTLTRSSALPCRSRRRCSVYRIRREEHGEADASNLASWAA